MTALIVIIFAVVSGSITWAALKGQYHVACRPPRAERERSK